MPNTVGPLPLIMAGSAPFSSMSRRISLISGCALAVTGSSTLPQRPSTPWLFGDRMLGLFIDGSENAAVMEMAFLYMKINASMYIPLLFVNILRLCIQGMGFTRVAMFAGLAEMIARTAVAIWVVPAAGFTGACFANPAAWVMADLFLFPCYFRVIRSLHGRLMPGTEPREENPKIKKIRRAA